ncbi:MAG: PmoA family protein [Phycisphaerae bacterium]|nr:PmoA family protein [Phycisphaerae bacterium]
MKAMENIWIVVLAAAVVIGLAAVLGRTAAAETEKKTQVEAVQDETAITLQTGSKKILQYYYAVKDVPAGADALYRRSGFIHPLWSPAGRVLTAIQPRDHYHHYGIWAPWTLTHIEGREVDFWNLAKGQGTVRYAGLESLFAGRQEGGFRVRQEHVDFTADKAGRVSIAETLEVRARPDTVDGKPVWVVDYISRQKNVLDAAIVLDAYRYGGGLGFRATPQWTRENCTVLTSEGKTRADADGTRARWCDVSGGFDDGGRAGILFLSHPSNRQHPEPMRVWPPDANGGRGDMFFEFCPIRLEGWTLEPGKEYVLRYRLIVYDGTLSSQLAETLWKTYADSADKP